MGSFSHGIEKIKKKHVVAMKQLFYKACKIKKNKKLHKLFCTAWKKTNTSLTCKLHLLMSAACHPPFLQTGGVSGSPGRRFAWSQGVLGLGVCKRKTHSHLLHGELKTPQGGVILFFSFEDKVAIMNSRWTQNVYKSPLKCHFMTPEVTRQLKIWKQACSANVCL